MSITIPVWLLWALGIISGVIVVAVITFIICLAWFGYEVIRAFGGGLNW